MDVCAECGKIHEKCKGHRKRKNTADVLQPCVKSPMTNGCCALHGGKSLSGIAHPNFKHGKYSKALPAGIRTRYETALESKDLTSLYDDIAFVDAQLADRLEKIYAGESIDFWRTAKRQLRDYKDALEDVATYAEGEPEWERAKSKEYDSLRSLTQTLERGMEAFTVFETVAPMIEQRRKLADTENKRLKDLTQTMTADEARAFMHAIGTSVKRHLECPEITEDVRHRILRNVQADINSLNAR